MKRTASQVLMKQNAWRARLCRRPRSLRPKHRVLPSRSRCSVQNSLDFRKPYVASIKFDVSFHSENFKRKMVPRSNNKKSAPKHRIAQARTKKISSRKNLSSENLLQNAKEYAIISLGRRSSGCIGVFAWITSMQGCRIASATACLFVYGSIILQISEFVNTFAGKSSLPLKKASKPIDKQEKT